MAVLPCCSASSASCASGQRFALRLPSDSQSPAKPLPSANSSPCRASKGLAPSSECALPGAPKKHAPNRGMLLLRYLSSLLRYFALFDGDAIKTIGIGETITFGKVQPQTQQPPTAVRIVPVDITGTRMQCGVIVQ